MKKLTILLIVIMLGGLSYIQASSTSIQTVISEYNAVSATQSTTKADSEIEPLECSITLSAEVDLGIITTTVSVTVTGPCEGLAEKANEALQDAIQELKDSMDEGIIAW